MALSFLLLLSTFLSIGSTLPWAGPQETGAASLTTTANWSPAPTSYAKKETSFLEAIQRDILPVSVCGWIGGNSAEPANCPSSSSCVWNSDYSIVGCCAAASSTCAFYTSCVDMNSAKQTEDNDKVYTCPGTSVCYRNTYPGSYYQYGCGAADSATFVATSYAGMSTPLNMVMTGADYPQASNTLQMSNSSQGFNIPQTSSTATANSMTISSTAIIVIALVCCVVVSGLIGLCICCRRKKRSRNNKPNHTYVPVQGFLQFQGQPQEILPAKNRAGVKKPKRVL